nr:sodium:proton antiporter [Lachnospiraceae bacterium]
LSAEPAILGTVLHMANHTLVKLVVFLTAGVVYQNCHELNLNKIKGFGRKKPLLAIPFLLGGMSLAGIPGFPGYLSKSILHESLLEGLSEAGLSSGAVALSEWTFIISGGATLCYMAKLFFCLFIEKPVAGAGSSVEATKDYAAVTQKAVLLVPAVSLITAGLFLSVKNFGTLYEFEVLKGGLTSVAIGALLFTLIMLTLNRGGEYSDKWPKWLDLEEKIYRPLLLTVLPLTIGLFARIMDRITDRLALLLRKTVFRDAPIKPERVEGTVFTRFVGHGMDVIVAKLKGKSEVEPEYETRLALRAMEQKENNLVTMRSLSYGLMLACLGIFVMLGFILYLVFIK